MESHQLLRNISRRVNNTKKLKKKVFKNDLVEFCCVNLFVTQLHSQMCVHLLQGFAIELDAFASI